MADIRTERVMDSWEVRNTCIKMNLYSLGNNEEYSAMLNKCDELEPTYENLYEIAKDICEHSIDQTITNIMYSLERDAIRTFFFIDGEEY